MCLAAGQCVRPPLSPFASTESDVIMPFVEVQGGGAVSLHRHSHLLVLSVSSNAGFQFPDFKLTKRTSGQRCTTLTRNCGWHSRHSVSVSAAASQKTYMLARRPSARRKNMTELLVPQSLYGIRSGNVPSGNHHGDDGNDNQ